MSESIPLTTKPTAPPASNTPGRCTRNQAVLAAALAVLVSVATLTAVVVALRHKADDTDAYPVHPASDAIVAAALNATAGYERLATLCDAYGHRLSGSAALADAIAWLAAELAADGFANVTLEPVNVTHWVRGDESLALVTPPRIARPLPMLGLGGSGPTPPAGLEGPVTIVDSLAAAQALPDNALNNASFLLINQKFTTYGATSPARRLGPAEAARVGALAALVRSVTPYSLQSPHTGSMEPASVPGAAITLEDADLIARLTAAGTPPTLRLHMEAHTLPDKALSHNVVADLVGSEFPDEYVVLGGHIDSWDVGTGALDDGGGVVACWEALRIISSLGLVPRRTIRLVAWTNEENGAAGAAQFAADHASELDSISFALESDSGVFSPTGFGFSGSDEAYAIIAALVSHIDGLSAESLAASRPGGGVDIQPLIDAGVPGAGLLVGHDLPSSYYFYFHHTQADTFDKVDLRGFQECVAAIAELVWEVANLDHMLPRPAPPPPPAY